MGVHVMPFTFLTLDCKDEVSFCAEYAPRYCYHTYLKTNCKKTCNECRKFIISILCIVRSTAAGTSDKKE